MPVTPARKDLRERSPLEPVIRTQLLTLHFRSSSALPRCAAGLWSGKTGRTLALVNYWNTTRRLVVDGAHRQDPRRDLRLKNSDSSPTPNSNPPVPAAPDATRANLSPSPLSPASLKWRRRLDWLTQVRLLNATVVGGSAGTLIGSLAGSFLGYPLLGALGVGLGALLFLGETGPSGSRLLHTRGSQEVL